MSSCRAIIEESDVPVLLHDAPRRVRTHAGTVETKSWPELNPFLVAT